MLFFCDFNEIMLTFFKGIAAFHEFKLTGLLFRSEVFKFPISGAFENRRSARTDVAVVLSTENLFCHFGQRGIHIFMLASTNQEQTKTRILAFYISSFV